MFPLINFDEPFVKIDFDNPSEMYFIYKYIHLQKIYKRWLNKINQIETYINNQINPIMKSIFKFKNMKDFVKNASEDEYYDIEEINNKLKHSTTYYHMPDIEILNNIMYDKSGHCSDCDSDCDSDSDFNCYGYENSIYDDMSIDFDNFYNIDNIIFTINSHYNYDSIVISNNMSGFTCKHKSTYKLILYMMYNNIPEYNNK